MVAEEHDDWRDHTASVVPPVLQAALDCFAESGYHGATMRTLAARAGLSIPGFYYHYDSKHTVLVALMDAAMDDLRRRSLAALAEAGGSAAQALDLHVECLVLYHAHRGPLAFVAASELRALEPDARARIVAARDRQQALLHDIVERGIADGAFEVEHPGEAVRALITMCTGVAQWYRMGGPLTPEELAERYVALGRRLLGVGGRR